MHNDEPYTGRYTRAFLDGLVGKGNYRVRSFSLDVLSTAQGIEAAMNVLDDETLSFAYVSDTKLTCFWINDCPGWMKFCDKYGIEITASSKIAKRVTVITRLTYLATFASPKNFRMRAVSPADFTVYDEIDPDVSVAFLDGANVISRELLEQMIAEGSEKIDETFKGRGLGNPWAKTLINRSVDYAGSFSIRITTPEGLIKGDALCVPRDRMGGYDVLYCRENLKTELKTKFIFCLAEPHPGIRRHEFSRDVPAPPPVWTDDQTMSWLGPWLYPNDQIVDALSDFTESVYSKIADGEFPEFFTNTIKRDDELQTITQFQEQALRFEAEGLGLQQSIFLQERIGQGAINQISTKRHWPVPCAMYVHVATDSWLHMAGYYNPQTGEHPWPFDRCVTPRGFVWYHEESGRLVYNDLDFADLYERHGGWDLDDSIKAHFRTIHGEKKVVNVRSPNSYGEYDIKNYVEGTYAPTWTRSDGTVIEFPPVSDEHNPPAYLEDLDITYKRTSLSPSRPVSPTYTREMVKESVQMSQRFRGVLGRRLNADMAYFASTGNYRHNQLCPIESIVDACTQEQSQEALDAINADTEAILRELRTLDITVDRTLWKQRVKRFFPEMKYAHMEWTRLSVLHDNLCDLYRRKYFELAQTAVDNIDPDVIDLGRAFASKGERLVKEYYKTMMKTKRHDNESRTAFYHRVNDTFCELFAPYDERVIYDNVLAMARYVYTHKRGNEYKDTVMFQCSARVTDPSIYDYYIRALNFYGVGQKDWSTMIDCSACNEKRIYTDRLEYQMHLLREKCKNC